MRVCMRVYERIVQRGQWYPCRALLPAEMPHGSPAAGVVRGITSRYDSGRGSVEVGSSRRGELIGSVKIFQRMK